ncbi:hypothetical protein Tco_0907461 [Tanacetum coccineum]|uniref:Uncharacterized protein n=1 Tax=Tanacetum coccineum TaxID=301880 RepID=A0ABQ5CJC3_9ASTR
MRIKKKDQGDLQIQGDAELAQRLHEEELAELERRQKEREEREQFTIEERAKFLVEMIEAQRKFRASQRAIKIISKPPTRTQLRNLMITYLKNKGGYKYSQLKGKTYEEIHGLYERQQKRNQDFIQMDIEVINDSGKKNDSSSKPAGGSRKKTLARKRACEKKSEESAKKQKLEDVAVEQELAKSDEEVAAYYKHEKEELRMWLIVVSDEEETMDTKILSAKYPIVDWESQNLRSIRFGRFAQISDEKRMKFGVICRIGPLLVGISWKLYESYGVHILLMDGTLTCFKILVEKRYPLIKEMLQKMLNWKLEAEAESIMAFELLKFIKS